MTEAELADLYAWMQSVIVDPRPDDAVQAEAAARAEQTIHPTDDLTSYDRLKLYRDQYLVRMGDALRIDYPTLARWLGTTRFRALTEAYVVAHPSRGYSLYRLGDNLPEFITRWREQLPERAFCAELARFERTLTQAFNEPPSPVLEALPDVSRGVVPVAALRLLTCVYPVNDFIQAMLDDGPPPAVRRRPAWLAVFRIKYEMARLDMRRSEYRALSALVEGRTLEEASTAAQNGEDPLTAGEAAACFARWCGLGMFAAVRDQE